MKITVAATKTNLIRARKTLALTREGHELLDQKRKILMTELTAAVHVAQRLQQELDASLKNAYAALDKATVVMGRKRLASLSFSIDIKSTLSLSQRRVMGVTLPLVTLKMAENPPYYSPYDVSFYVDETISQFKGVLKLVAQLTEKRIALLRLAKEMQKTVRKVNALEKIYIPHYSDTVKYVGDRLDEESRDAFSMLKLIKVRLRK